MKSLDNYNDVLDVKEVAEYLNISKPLVRKLCQENKLKSIRIGWLYKITKFDLLEFINQSKS
jgi:excisionase family DNA binding protein